MAGSASNSYEPLWAQMAEQCRPEESTKDGEKWWRQQQRKAGGQADTRRGRPAEPCCFLCSDRTEGRWLTSCQGKTKDACVQWFHPVCAWQAPEISYYVDSVEGAPAAAGGEGGGGGRVPQITFRCAEHYEPPLYCSCRKPDEGNEEMWECGNCREWYHYSCEGVADGNEPELCASCVTRRARGEEVLEEEKEANGMKMEAFTRQQTAEQVMKVQEWLAEAEAVLQWRCRHGEERVVTAVVGADADRRRQAGYLALQKVLRSAATFEAPPEQENEGGEAGGGGEEGGEEEDSERALPAGLEEFFEGMMERLNRLNTAITELEEEVEEWWGTKGPFFTSDGGGRNSWSYDHPALEQEIRDLQGLAAKGERLEVPQPAVDLTAEAQVVQWVLKVQTLLEGAEEGRGGGGGGAQTPPPVGEVETLIDEAKSLLGENHNRAGSTLRFLNALAHTYRTWRKRAQNLLSGMAQGVMKGVTRDIIRTQLASGESLPVQIPEMDEMEDTLSFWDEWEGRAESLLESLERGGEEGQSSGEVLSQLQGLMREAEGYKYIIKSAVRDNLAKAISLWSWRDQVDRLMSGEGRLTVRQVQELVVHGDEQFCGDDSEQEEEEEEDTEDKPRLEQLKACLKDGGDGHNSSAIKAVAALLKTPPHKLELEEAEKVLQQLRKKILIFPEEEALTARVGGVQWASKVRQLLDRVQEGGEGGEGGGGGRITWTEMTALNEKVPVDEVQKLPVYLAFSKLVSQGESCKARAGVLLEEVQRQVARKSGLNGHHDGDTKMEEGSGEGSPRSGGEEGVGLGLDLAEQTVALLKDVEEGDVSDIPEVEELRRVYQRAQLWVAKVSAVISVLRESSGAEEDQTALDEEIEGMLQQSVQLPTATGPGQEREQGEEEEEEISKALLLTPSKLLRALKWRLRCEQICRGVGGEDGDGAGGESDTRQSFPSLQSIDRALGESKRLLAWADLPQTKGAETNEVDKGEEDARGGVLLKVSEMVHTIVSGEVGRLHGQRWRLKARRLLDSAMVANGGAGGGRRPIADASSLLAGVACLPPAGASIVEGSQELTDLTGAVKALQQAGKEAAKVLTSSIPMPKAPSMVGQGPELQQWEERMDGLLARLQDAASELSTACPQLSVGTEDALKRRLKLAKWYKDLVLSGVTEEDDSPTSGGEGAAAAGGRGLVDGADLKRLHEANQEAMMKAMDPVREVFLRRCMSAVESLQSQVTAWLGDLQKALQTGSGADGSATGGKDKDKDAEAKKRKRRAHRVASEGDRPVPKTIVSLADLRILLGDRVLQRVAMSEAADLQAVIHSAEDWEGWASFIVSGEGDHRGRDNTELLPSKRIEQCLLAAGHLRVPDTLRSLVQLRWAHRLARVAEEIDEDERKRKKGSKPYVNDLGVRQLYAFVKKVLDDLDRVTGKGKFSFAMASWMTKSLRTVRLLVRHEKMMEAWEATAKETFPALFKASSSGKKVGAVNVSRVAQALKECRSLQLKPVAGMREVLLDALQAAAPKHQEIALHAGMMEVAQEESESDDEDGEEEEEEAEEDDDESDDEEDSESNEEQSEPAPGKKKKAASATSSSKAGGKSGSSGVATKKRRAPPVTSKQIPWKLEPCANCRKVRGGGISCRVEKGHHKDPDWNKKGGGRWEAPPGFWEWYEQNYGRTAKKAAARAKMKAWTSVLGPGQAPGVQSTAGSGEFSVAPISIPSGGGASSSSSSSSAGLLANSSPIVGSLQWKLSNGSMGTPTASSAGGSFGSGGPVQVTQPALPPPPKPTCVTSGCKWPARPKSAHCSDMCGVLGAKQTLEALIEVKQQQDALSPSEGESFLGADKIKATTKHMLESGDKISVARAKVRDRFADVFSAGRERLGLPPNDTFVKILSWDMEAEIQRMHPLGKGGDYKAKMQSLKFNLAYEKNSELFCEVLLGNTDIQALCGMSYEDLADRKQKELRKKFAEEDARMHHRENESVGEEYRVEDGTLVKVVSLETKKAAAAKAAAAAAATAASIDGSAGNMSSLLKPRMREVVSIQGEEGKAPKRARTEASQGGGEGGGEGLATDGKREDGSTGGVADGRAPTVLGLLDKAATGDVGDDLSSIPNITTPEHVVEDDDDLLLTQSGLGSPLPVVDDVRDFAADDNDTFGSLDHLLEAGGEEGGGGQGGGGGSDDDADMDVDDVEQLHDLNPSILSAPGVGIGGEDGLDMDVGLDGLDHLGDKAGSQGLPRLEGEEDIGRGAPVRLGRSGGLGSQVMPSDGGSRNTSFRVNMPETEEFRAKVYAPPTLSGDLHGLMPSGLHVVGRMPTAKVTEYLLDKSRKDGHRTPVVIFKSPGVPGDANEGAYMAFCTKMANWKDGRVGYCTGWDQKASRTELFLVPPSLSKRLPVLEGVAGAGEFLTGIVSYIDVDAPPSPAAAPAPAAVAAAPAAAAAGAGTSAVKTDGAAALAKTNGVSGGSAEGVAAAAAAAAAATTTPAPPAVGDTAAAYDPLAAANAALSSAPRPPPPAPPAAAAAVGGGGTTAALAPSPLLPRDVALMDRIADTIVRSGPASIVEMRKEGLACVPSRPYPFIYETHPDWRYFKDRLERLLAAKFGAPPPPPQQQQQQLPPPPPMPPHLPPPPAPAAQQQQQQQQDYHWQQQQEQQQQQHHHKRGRKGRRDGGGAGGGRGGGVEGARPLKPSELGRQLMLAAKSKQQQQQQGGGGGGGDALGWNQPAIPPHQPPPRDRREGKKSRWA